jgi:hypothetical protein
VSLSKDKKKKAATSKSKKASAAAANFYVESPLKKDDVEEMKVRAQQVRTRLTSDRCYDKKIFSFGFIELNG